MRRGDPPQRRPIVPACSYAIMSRTACRAVILNGRCHPTPRYRLLERQAWMKPVLPTVVAAKFVRGSAAPRTGHSTDRKAAERLAG